MYANLPTSQGYIFRILQHFATKLCRFSNFDNFFPKISLVIPRLNIFLKRKSSILIILQKVPHKSVMYLYKHMHKGDIDIAVFIDLKKAFDTVDHNILLNKLMRYGIKDND